MDLQLIYVIFAQISHSNSHETLKKFCSWLRADIIGYQGMNNFYNVIILLYGNEKDVRKPHPQIKNWGLKNRDKIKQIYRVFSDSRVAIQNTIEKDLKQSIYSRKDKSQYVFWRSFPKDCIETCHKNDIKMNQNDFDIKLYEDDLNSIFPVLKKLLFNTNNLMTMTPLLDECLNENFYIFPLNYVSINNSFINYENIVKRISTHLKCHKHYKIEIKTLENIPIESFIQNLCVFFEQHMGIKMKMQVICCKNQGFYSINSLFSNPIHYLLCLLSVLISVQQSVNGGWFIINDLIFEDNWNQVKEVAYSTYKNNRMLVIDYDGKKFILKRRNIYPKVSTTQEIAMIDSSVNANNMRTSDYLPYSARLRYERSNLKDEKEKDWCNTISSIPFGKYFTLNVVNPKKRNLDGISTLLQNENVSHSMCELSEDIYLSNLLNPTSQKKHILLSGPPGNGKTHYSINILPKILNNRPICFISLAGLQDPHVLLGHDFTYIGAKPGKIIQNIIDAQCLDPIIVFDEIDKADVKIQNVLVSLLDPLQNNAFKDQFLGNVPIDLSKSFFVMTCNSHNAEYILPPLLDRLFLIQVPCLLQHDQIKILKNVIFPKIIEGMLTTDTSIIKQLCDDEHVLKEVLKLSREFNCNHDSETSSSLRCIEKTAYKVFLEFIKYIIKSFPNTENNNEIDITSYLLFVIKYHNEKIHLQNVFKARDSFQRNESKREMMSHLYI